jgi:hypothetical protein
MVGKPVKNGPLIGGNGQLSKKDMNQIMMNRNMQGFSQAQSNTNSNR